MLTLDGIDIRPKLIVALFCPIIKNCLSNTREDYRSSLLPMIIKQTFRLPEFIGLHVQRKAHS
jgi:hypothetical protein